MSKQDICLQSRVSIIRLPKPQARYPHLPNVRTTTRGRGNDYTDGGTRHVNGETLTGWGVIARSPPGRIVVMFGPVITAEAHLAFSGARTHSNNTAEMTAKFCLFSALFPRAAFHSAFLYLL